MTPEEEQEIKNEFDISRKEFQDTVFNLYGYIPRFTTLQHFSHSEDRLLFRGWQLAKMHIKTHQQRSKHVWQSIVNSLEIDSQYQKVIK